MHKISTLFFLLFTCTCFAQLIPDSSAVVVSAIGFKRPPRQYCVYKTSPISKDTALEECKDTVRKPVNIRTHCVRTLKYNEQPLVVVNGAPLKPNSLNNINPADIDSIWILKGAEATALFGADAMNGAILITTKLIYKKITIKDMVDNSPIPAATMSFSIGERENTLRYIADANGVILSNSWNELAQSPMNVSAVGYKTFSRDTPGNDSVIYLDRDVKICQEVVISQTYCPKRITLYCTCSGITIKRDSTMEEPAAPLLTGFKIYPNPAKAGASVNIRFNDSNVVSVIRVLDLQGRVLLQRPVDREQKSVFNLETDPRWPAGIYFVQLLYENGRVGASEKVIIQ